jgi:hypothetical protein
MGILGKRDKLTLIELFSLCAFAPVPSIYNFSLQKYKPHHAFTHSEVCILEIIRPFGQTIRLETAPSMYHCF